MNLRFEMPKGQISVLLKNRWVLWGLRYLTLLLLFTVFYLPLSSQQKKIQKVYEHKSKQIETAKQGGLQVLKPEEMTTLQKRVDDFEKRMADASRPAQLLAYLSETAAAHHIKLTKINSESATPVTDTEKKEMQLIGKRLMRVPVTLRFETDYKTFVTYLHELTTTATSPKYVAAVEVLSLKTGSIPERVTIDLTLSFFGVDGL